MFTYSMDVEPESLWLRTTPSQTALSQPYYCTEAGRFYGRRLFATARSNKESYLIFYTFKGAGLIEQGDTQAVLKKGQALLLNCREPQSYCTAPGYSCWHHCWVHLDGAGVKAMESILNPQGRISPVSVSVPETEETMEQVFRSINGTETLETLHLGLALHRLLSLLAQGQLDGSRDATNQQIIMRSAQRLRQQYAQPFSLDEFLRKEKIPLCKSYYLRVFRKYMGTTPYNYLLNYRMTQAKELLVMTDLSVTEIARRVGFGNESNFSTRFAGIAGQSPQQYRKDSLRPNLEE